MADNSTPSVSARGRAARAKASKEPKQAKVHLGKLSSAERAERAAAERAAREAKPTARSIRERFFRRPATKILFFINGPVPTADDLELASKLGRGCVFRNAKKIVAGAPLENCDYVAGDVPEDYLRYFSVARQNAEVDDEEVFNDPNIIRPNRTKLDGNNPDDHRPGTVDTGEAHASGTGSSQPGMGSQNRTPNEAETNKQVMDAWRAGNFGSGVVRNP